MNLVVMAAGMGSRYGGLKQVESFGAQGETLLEYSIYDAVKAGFNRIIFVIRPDMEEMFKEGVLKRVSKAVEASYVFQELTTGLPEGYEMPESRTKPWGTAHAVLCAKDVVDGPFAVINADDYYGPSAFQVLADFLKEDSPAHALVGYFLKNTLSSHGTVSRGICTMNKAGDLASVEEHTCIARNSEGQLVDWDSKGHSRVLTGNEVTSLNLWGFRKNFMEELESKFEKFLKTLGRKEGSEWYLPVVVDDGINDERFRVEVLPTDEAWFGVTYKEDRDEVARAINERIQSGVYPSNLWSSTQLT